MKRSLVISCIFLASCYGHKTIVNLPIPPGLTEAQAGFENPPQTNGHESQADMDNDRSQFEQATSPQVEGPFMNNVQCSACHFNPASGGNSAVFEHRVSPDDVGSDPDDNVAPASLVHAGAVPGFGQQVAVHGNVNALRRSLSLFGDSLVEQVPATEFVVIASQNGGQYVMVPVLEAPGTNAIGRFGWKCQEPTLLSFAGDAAFNELGEGNRLVPDPVNGIEDNDNPTLTRPEDIDNYQNFMQSLKAPPQGPSTAQSARGEQLFSLSGCEWCHVPTLYTDKQVFHPFGDFLLHDVGTGDGIQQGPAPANKMRTAPLWGVSHLERFLHDGRAFDMRTAIEAHKKEANFARKKFNALTGLDQQALLAFLGTL